jgi:hypothetical protein
MTKFDLYEKSGPISTPPPGGANSVLQFVCGVSLWFILVFYVGYLLLA